VHTTPFKKRLLPVVTKRKKANLVPDPERDGVHHFRGHVTRMRGDLVGFHEGGNGVVQVVHVQPLVDVPLYGVLGLGRPLTDDLVEGREVRTRSDGEAKVPE